MDEAKNLTEKTDIIVDVGDDLSGVSTNSEFIVPVPSFVSVSTPPTTLPPPVSPIASIPPISPVHDVTYSLKLSINTKYVRDTLL